MSTGSFAFRRKKVVLQACRNLSSTWVTAHRFRMSSRIFRQSIRRRTSLGYPTQKPLALLERIIAASSDDGDVILDPFCGCGTAVHAAEKLKRQWIGIDITH